MSQEEKRLSLLKKIEYPNILGKIDLSMIQNDTRPKGLTKKQLKKLKNSTINFAAWYLKTNILNLDNDEKKDLFEDEITK